MSMSVCLVELFVAVLGVSAVGGQVAVAASDELPRWAIISGPSICLGR